MIKVYKKKIKEMFFDVDEMQLKLCKILSEFLEQESFFSKYSSRGVYVHGSVGSGKTTIMDLFFKNTKIKSKKRIHMSEFLIEIQDLMKDGKIYGYDDPIKYVIKKYKKIKLFCVDEFEVNDIVTSVFIRRIFDFLIKKKCILILTSNTIPENLYKNGLQRDKFLELILKIREKMYVFCLDSGVDYRKIDKNYIKEHKIITIKNKTDEIIDEFIFSILEEKTNLKEKTIKSFGRDIVVKFQKNLAVLDFNEFCFGNFGSNDYIEICKKFESIFIYNICEPKFENLDSYRRFCFFIDAVYDLKKNLYGICDFDYKNFNTKPFVDKIPQIVRCFSRLFELG